MKYTESTSLEEIGRWMDKNLYVEFYDIHSGRWIKKADKDIFSGSKYRLVEKPVAREGWVYLEDLRGIVPNSGSGTNAIHVREILEDK